MLNVPLPQVGKAYVRFARLLQCEGSAWSLEMAQRALMRAWQILSAMRSRADGEAATIPASINDFGYLIGHLQQGQYSEAFTAMASAGVLASPHASPLGPMAGGGGGGWGSPLPGLSGGLTPTDAAAALQQHLLAMHGGGAGRRSGPASPLAVS